MAKHAMTNDELQAAIDATMTYIRGTSSGSYSPDYRKELLAHLTELLRIQRVRALAADVDDIKVKYATVDAPFPPRD